MMKKRIVIFICLLLVAVNLTVFWQVQQYDFVYYDDHLYVTDNTHVRSGLSGGSVTWAFTSTYAGNWHPLTWLSLMVDYELYGLHAGGYHWTNLLLHIGCTLLLFLTLQRMTGALWKSGFVAALFAIHPLHVESVAWVAERKDVLCGFFWMLTMWLYVLYAEKPGWYRYGLVVGAFIFGLMSKPMLVTLPFVLLLLDYWPLGRFHISSVGQKKITTSHAIPLILEKIPLIFIVVIASVLTVVAQNKAGALKSMEHLPFDIRVSNSLVSYVSYIEKMIWPFNLAVFYPHPGTIHFYKTLGAFLVLATTTFFVIRWIQRLPYIAVGWFWYMGTLLPVIGLIQIGGQAMADRYTYIPLIGVFMIITWGVPDLLKIWRYRHISVLLLAVIVVLVLVNISRFQVSHWRNAISLFEHAVLVTEHNYLAHNNLGAALYRNGNVDEAIKHYEIALRITPGYMDAYYNLGLAYADQEKYAEAISSYIKALKLKPDFVEGHNNIGIAFAKQGQYEKAIFHFREALRFSPDYRPAIDNLGLAVRESESKKKE